MRRPPQIGVYRARRGGKDLRRNAAVAGGLFAVLVVLWLAIALLRPIPAPQLVFTISTHPTVNGAPLTLSPPAGVEEAIALEGIGTIAAAGGETPTPIASLTKMMSALVVLSDHPLAPGASGPTLTITAADVATYENEAAQQDSVVKVQLGEQLSELQALEASLIPSGDNIIQLLATWDKGSTGAFVSRMNALARSLRMDHTHYADPAGVDPATASTAADQLRLAEEAIANPVFAGIVAMPQVTLPVAGVQYNVDADLGSDGIDGIKTGWIPQGGGCFVFSAQRRAEGRTVTVIGAVLGEQGSTPLPTALSEAKRLVLATGKTLRVFHLPAGATVAMMTAPYASAVPIVTASPISFVDWSGARPRLSASTLGRSTGAPAGSRVGTLTLRLGRTRAFAALTALGRVTGPSLSWRLTRL